MIYPEALVVNGLEYEINTGYEYALAAFACANDPEMGDVERAYGIIGLLYKEAPEDLQAALDMAVKYLQMGKERQDPEEQDMDFEQDMHYIRASFRSDYGIDLNTRPDMHWWEFCELLQGLTDDCVLNRIRDLRNYDMSTIKDPKTRAKIRRAKQSVALKECRSSEEEDELDAFYDQLK